MRASVRALNGVDFGESGILQCSEVSLCDGDVQRRSANHLTLRESFGLCSAQCVAREWNASMRFSASVRTCYGINADMTELGGIMDRVSLCVGQACYLLPFAVCACMKESARRVDLKSELQKQAKLNTSCRSGRMI